MSQNPYLFHRSDGTDMLGRKRILEQIIRHLTKENPQHLSLIGPRQIGKSILLRNLAQKLDTEDGTYEFVVYWNLAHDAPKDDEEFFGQLHERIRAKVAPVDAELAEWFKEEDLRDGLNGFLDELVSGDRKLLLILDSLDTPLSSEALTRVSLDWLRSLNDLESAVLVASSRATLLDLCKSAETESSPLWNVFHKESIGPWDESEWDDILTPLVSTGSTVHRSARESLQEWTNGIPALSTLVLANLFETHQGVEIHGAAVDELCDSLARPDTEIVKWLWDDCPLEWQSDVLLLRDGPIAKNSMEKPHRLGLTDRGFVRVRSGNVEMACKFMSEMADLCGGEISNLNRLFTQPDAYTINIRKVLLKRLEQIDGPDPTLHRFIVRAIEDLKPDPHPSPEVLVTGIRGIEDHAMNLILAAECPDGVVPQSWYDTWTEYGRDLPDWLHDHRVPRPGAQRRRLIQIMAGDAYSEKVSQFISKPTSLLVGHLHDAGDFGQHREDAEVSFGFAVSICFAAIELCDHLARELP